MSADRRVALDKEKDFVKDKIHLSGAEHRLLWRPERVLRTETLGHHRFITLPVDRSTNHRYDRNCDP